VILSPVLSTYAGDNRGARDKAEEYRQGFDDFHIPPNLRLKPRTFFSREKEIAEVAMIFSARL
jgi:hypothetical protein